MSEAGPEIGMTRCVVLRVEHVYAELDAARDEVVLYVHWSGGHVTELRHPRRRRKPGSTPSQLREVIESLRCVADDEAIARILNRARLHTERGQSWTKRRVSAFRRRHGIAALQCPEEGSPRVAVSGRGRYQAADQPNECPSVD